MTDCTCQHPPFHYTDFESRPVGTDPRQDGEVTIETCRKCGTLWLRYFIDSEPPYPHSGRWWRGAIDPATAAAMTPDTAIAYLKGLPWHFCGGTYFDSTGFRRDVPDLLGLF